MSLLQALAIPAQVGAKPPMEFVHICRKHKQDHLLADWDSLSEHQRVELLRDIQVGRLHTFSAMSWSIQNLLLGTATMDYTEMAIPVLGFPQTVDLEHLGSAYKTSTSLAQGKTVFLEPRAPATGRLCYYCTRGSLNLPTAPQLQPFQYTAAHHGLVNVLDRGVASEDCSVLNLRLVDGAVQVGTKDGAPEPVKSIKARLVPPCHALLPLPLHNKTLTAQALCLQDITPLEKIRWVNLGYALIAQGKLGVVILAGGQGTRLGSSAPKANALIHSPQSRRLVPLLCSAPFATVVLPSPAWPV